MAEEQNNETRDPIFGGRGQPLQNYAIKEDEWPAAWLLPEQGDDEDGNEPDLFEKFAWLADDLTVRQAINIWDNGIRMPGAFEGIVGGVLSAHARLVVGYGANSDLEAAADAIRDAWLGMAKQAALLGGPAQ